MRIYRIEDEAGIGPYTVGSHDFLMYMALEHDVEHCYSLHPVEWSEMLGSEGYYGFTSMDALREWFDYFGSAGYSYLRRQGLSIVVYEVCDHEVEIFPTQTIFRRSCATKIGLLPFPI